MCFNTYYKSKEYMQVHYEHQQWHPSAMKQWCSSATRLPIFMQLTGQHNARSSACSDIHAMQ